MGIHDEASECTVMRPKSSPVTEQGKSLQVDGRLNGPKIQTKVSGARAISPESSIDSAPINNRRLFLKRAALTTAAVAVGSTILERAKGVQISQASNGESLIIGQSNCGSAKTSLITDFIGCSLYIENTNSAGTPLYVQGVNAHALIGSVGVGVYGQECESGNIAVWGQAYGSGGIGVEGDAVDACAIPIVARASCRVTQVANLQEWQSGSGTPVSVVNKCGWFGIGTASPTSQLDVVGSASISGTLTAGTFSPNSLCIPGGGNAHIGGSVTTGYCVVVDHGNHNSGPCTGPGAGSVIFGCFPCGSGEGISSNRSTSSGNNQYGLDFYTGRNRRVSITNCGNVGIGTVTPESTLCVKANGGNVSASGSITAGYCLRVDNGNSNRGCLSPGLVFGCSGGSGVGISSPQGCMGTNLHGLNFFAGGKVRMAISSTGQVAIGAIPSSSALCVNGICSSVAIHACGGSAGTVPLVAQGIMGQTANLQQWQIESTVVSAINKCGWLGVGTPNPTSPIDVVSRCSVGIRASIVCGFKGIAISGCSPCDVGVSGSGKVWGVFGESTSGAGVSGSATSTGKGVCGTSTNGIGVSGSSGTRCGVFGNSICGTGVMALVTGAKGIPLIAKGSAGHKSPLQQWEKYCGTALAVINKCGWLGIGTSCPTSSLDVLGSASISGKLTAGTFSPSCISIPKGTISVSDCAASAVALSADSTSSGGIGIRSTGGCVAVQGLAGSSTAVPFVAKGTAGQKGNLMQFENSCGAALSVVNPCGWLGVGRPCAPTTLAVAGSVSANVATPCGPYSMKNSDFAVLANGNVTLPAANTAKGMIVFIKNVSSGAITVSVSGSDKIEGKKTESLSKEYKSLMLMSDGKSPGNWYILSSAT